MDPKEANIKLYARNMLEKILLDKTLYCATTGGNMDMSPLMRDEYGYLLENIDKDSLKSLKMILLVFYNQYYVVSNEQIDKFDNIDYIDFQDLFANSKKMNVTIFRKIQKVKTLFKRFLSDKNETEKVAQLESLSLKSEYKEFFSDKDNFRLAEEYFQNMNYLTKYHSD